MRVRLLPAADAELIAAARRYQGLAKGLGEQLLSEAIDGFTEIERHHRRFPRVESRTAHEVRRYLLNRFPFAIVYAVTESECVVVAFAHSAQRPRYWRKRLP